MGLAVVVAWTSRSRLRPVTEGVRAPRFAAQALDGGAVRLDDYRGSVVLVNIWATWCAPCRTEMPSLQKLYDEFAGDGFEVLAVSVDARPGERDSGGRAGRADGELARFAEDLGLTFPILREPTGSIELSYQTWGVPESFLIDRDGVIRKRVPGATVWDHPRYRDLIRELLQG
jgi:peroxiredoxin